MAMRDRIDDRFGPETTLAIKALLSGKTDPEAFPAIERWVRQCYHRPRQGELIMEALNAVLEGYGVEAIRDENAWDSYHGDIIATYVNMGDPYTSTVLYDVENDRYLTTTWGDFVEEREL